MSEQGENLITNQLERMKSQFKRKGSGSNFGLMSSGKLNNKDQTFVVEFENHEEETVKKELDTKKMIRQIDEMTKFEENKVGKKNTEEEEKKKEEEEECKKEGMKTHDEMRMDLISRGISPEYEPAFVKEPPKKKKELNVNDVRTFVTTTAPRDYGMIKCYIERKGGLIGKIFPKYMLYHQKSKKFLMSARRRKKTKTASYLLSLDKDDLVRSSGNYFGKIRGNFIGTEFILYDKGDNPINVKSNDQTARNMMLGVKFEKNFLGSSGPRKVTVILPKINTNGKYIEFPEKVGEPTLIGLFNKNEWDNLIILKNSKPSWNTELNSYVLNFNGRVTLPSVKNLQLVDPRKQSKILLQFGKIEKNKFVLDYRYPMSCIQAFAISMCIMDRKIGCE